MPDMTYNTPVGYSFLETRFSGVSRRIARLPIGDFPTSLEHLGDANSGLWVKRDDETHTVYGGNKVRKLEYLLGDALARGCDSVVTFGGVGSNHALATALHSRSAGLDCSCMLMQQRRTDFIESTLQRHQTNETTLCRSASSRTQRIAQMRDLRDKKAGGLSVVPMGGTSPLGSIGYVNAAFELARQWRGAELPERIYLPAGTMGTAAGLAVGFDLLGWPTQIIATRVVSPSQCNDAAMATLCTKISRRLHQADNRIPYRCTIGPRVTIRTEYLGEDYAHATDASKAAVQHSAEHWGLPLETTYTGKAMACLLEDLAAAPADRKPWIFWHTYNGRPAGKHAKLSGDYRDFLSLGKG